MSSAKTLNQLYEQDARVMRDATLPVEAYRLVVAGAVPAFHEASIRDAIPFDILNVGIGAIQSRAVKVVDAGSFQHGMRGSGGTRTRINYAMDDQPYYPIWQIGEIPEREQEASTLNSSLGLDLLQDTGYNIGQQIVEGENQLLVSGLGPITGFTKASGIQTFAAGAAWTTQGQAWKDITKALGKLRLKKVPMVQPSIILHPTDWANLFQTYGSASENPQIDKLARFFGDRIYINTNVTSGKAYVYDKNRNVLRGRCAQDLTALPYPKTSLDDVVMERVVTTLHMLRPEGVCEITGC